MTYCWSPDFMVRPSFEYIVNTLQTVGPSKVSSSDINVNVIQLASRSTEEIYEWAVPPPTVNLTHAAGAVYENATFHTEMELTLV